MLRALPLRTAAGGTPTRRPHDVGSRRFVWGVAVLALAVRLPFAALPAGADEAGFLQVAHQWGPGGTSLYGSYWVDRPPLLLGLFRLADLAGGLVPLRMLGAVAVATTVLLCATSARLLAGPVAARWAAVAAAAMLVSPALGSLEVNGELLAAPFVAAGVAALIGATLTGDQRRASALAAAAGAAAVCALLVKQNFADVVVFGTVLVVMTARRAATGRTSRIVGGSVGGGFAALAVVGAWTVWRGTSLVAVFDAVYPFRLRAAQAIAAGGQAYADHRGLMLALATLTSGVALLVVAVVADAVRHRAWTSPEIALATLVVFDCVSIALGGGYWHHYLIQLAVPLAIWAGAVAAHGGRPPRMAVGLVAAVAAVALTWTGLHPPSSPGHSVGAAIARSARPGDTLTTLYGEPQVNLAAGLPSPYPHLWSLPVRTLDPHLAELDAVLTGPSAPTWLVVSHDITSWGLASSSTQDVITAHYRRLGLIDGQTIYLHHGESRSTPVPSPLVTAAIQEPS